MAMIVWAGKTIIDAETPAKDDYGVVVNNNRILASGGLQDLKARYPDADVTGGEQYLLTAAMINSHDHGRGLGMTPLGVPDDLLEIWIPGLWAQPQIDPYLAAAYDGIRLLQSGVSTVVHQHNPRDWTKIAEEAKATIQGYRDVGIRVVYCHPITDQNQLVYEDPPGFIASLPPELRAKAEPFTKDTPYGVQEYMDVIGGVIDKYHDGEEFTVLISAYPVGGQWCSDDLIMTLVEFAQARGTRVQMHLLETRYQKTYAYRRWEKSFVQHLDEIGALGPWFTLAHMVWVDEEDLPILAERAVGIAHNPGSNLRLRSGIAPVEKMIHAGICLGVGLDGHALDDDQDYLRALRLAKYLSNKPGVTSPVITSQDIWRMGTSSGASITLGQDEQTGRLAPGYLADLMLVDLEAVKGVWFAPETDPLDILLAHANRSHVVNVMVNGEWVVKEGRAVKLDEEGIISEIREQLDGQSDSVDMKQFAADARSIVPYVRQYYQGWEEG
jgi:5-methylthioadenosine/S-adenosylhomocysteine deaminase